MKESLKKLFTKEELRQIEAHVQRQGYNLLEYIERIAC